MLAVQSLANECYESSLNDDITFPISFAVFCLFWSIYARFYQIYICLIDLNLIVSVTNASIINFEKSWKVDKS